MNSNFHIIIPARFNATRLPGKLLLDLAGKPLIQRTYEQALLCKAASVTIATDDERIQSVATRFGARVCMTSADHPTGTDRLAEAANILGLADTDIVLNLQGDEPFVSISAVLQTVKAMGKNPSAAATTLATPIHTIEELLDPSIVKVVLDRNGYALYFSRAQIPFHRSANATDRMNVNEIPLSSSVYYRHLGLYAYRVKTLKQYSKWEPAPMEAVEQLEQLRLLWQGEKIHVSCVSEISPPGIDTEADLRVSREYFLAQA